MGKIQTKSKSFSCLFSSSLAHSLSDYPILRALGYQSIVFISQTDSAVMWSNFKGKHILYEVVLQLVHISCNLMTLCWQYIFVLTEALGAFISIFMIWIITGILVWMAIERIIRGSYDVNAPIMAITAAFGTVVNLM